MYRIFISHLSAEPGEAKALKDWLVQQDPPPPNDILVGADMVRPGPQWIDDDGLQNPSGTGGCLPQ